MQQQTPPFPIENEVEACDPVLYASSGVAEGVETFADVTEAWVWRYHAEGYLVIRHAFSRAAVEAARQGMLDLIAGKHPQFHGLTFEAKAKEVLPNLLPERREDVVRKLMWFVDFDARLKAMSEHPSLLALLKRLMGAVPELFQDMAMIKPPRIGREKPWHQDVAYFDIPVDTHVIGVWIALDDVMPKNGCMHILPGGHLTGPRLHYKRRDWQICDADMLGQKILAVPLPPGGCLLFHGLLPHGTPPNRSPYRRRALQFHYRPVGTPAISEEERLAVFGGEGKNVTC